MQEEASGVADAVGANLRRELKRRVRQLECLTGKTAIENEILREALELARSSCVRSINIEINNENDSY